MTAIRASQDWSLNVSALVGAEDFRCLPSHDVDHRLGGHAAFGDGSGNAENAVEVAGAPGGSALLPVAPECDLDDREADGHEEDRCFDVVGVGDGEPQVGLGQEEVEPSPGGECGENAASRSPVAAAPTTQTTRTSTAVAAVTLPRTVDRIAAVRNGARSATDRAAGRHQAACVHLAMSLLTTAPSHQVSERVQSLRGGARRGAALTDSYADLEGASAMSVTTRPSAAA
jgi:hypothetical protein